MTDNEIIKALECCANEDASCSECPIGKDYDCRLQIASYALETINRQKAEIERLNATMDTMVVEHNMLMKTTKSEAIKEFVERLRTKRGSHGEIWGEDIDNLVKEMTEGKQQT